MADHQPTRSQLIGTGVFDAVLRARLQWNEYANAVVSHYHAHVAVDDRIVEFRIASTAAQHDHCQRLNTQTIKRMLAGEIRMPVDIEDALLAALPPEWREHLLTQLLDRAGLLLAHKPPCSDDLVGQVDTPCDLMRNAAEAVQRILPMLADGTGIGPEDQPHFAAALNAINAVQGVCVTLTAQIANALPPGPERRILMRAVQP
ncbi:hypothetical protein DYQ93_11555 [Xanthomonas sp. LMG 8992]|uniref:hypothetical protein n=1 Tax=Xanthomonas sp. LMG 8992 TaxID=1591157 RepID=UPI00136BB9AC|nr:hypothetical protein [Xanthomonas sp. LMG 8992]MXV11656.1 hypothetical protein [Xanthomonas sp. LMG 8992]